MFVRKCPNCGADVEYAEKWLVNRANRSKSVCIQCRGEKIREAIGSGKNHHRWGKKHSAKTITKMRAKRKLQFPPMLGMKHTLATRRKMSKNNGMKKPDARRKRRLARIRELQEKHGQVIPNYNPEACELIEEYGRKHGYNFQHAENGGEFHIRELGYWIDGYDAQQNVVIEVDEPHHYKNGRLRKKDATRQQEIEEHLGCKFIRIKE
ncbi:hypothetical protein LCGC14_2256630 [marine sediment metagenome]|uniref:Nuclease associated modular domain-containing protein n=1 Tax=marine sediment metagenome TaxID=412755 RepID=A0A0F9D1C8_9ZZZZ